eukprot:g2306.t1
MSSAETAARGASPAFEYLITPGETESAGQPSPMKAARSSSPTDAVIAAAATAGDLLNSATAWSQSPLWDRTYDEARFHSLVERHRNDPEWLFFELKVTRRRMHEAWADNQELAARSEMHSRTQEELDKAKHTIIDLKREYDAAVRGKEEDAALLSRLRGRCESLLVANERLEEFYRTAQISESKWVTGLAECETYMKQLVEQLKDSSAARDHYKKWAVDRTEQLREAEDTLTKLLEELRSTVQQRNAHQAASAELQKKVQQLTNEFNDHQESSRIESASYKKQQAYLQEEIVALKAKLATSESTRMELQSRADELKRSCDKTTRSLTAQKKSLAASEQEVLNLREAKLSLEEQLSMESEKVAELDTKLVHNCKELEKVVAKSTERKSKIQLMSKEISELRLALEKSHWSNEVARVEREREVADVERQKEALNMKYTSLKVKYSALQQAIQMAQAGAEAAAVAKVVAKHEMATERALQEAKSSRSTRTAQMRDGIVSESMEAGGETLQPKRRSVLGASVIQSLEKNVVDYALLSLQRTSLQEKSTYEIEK